MRLLLQISLCCLLAGSATAQRHGGGGFGGGGGMRGGSGGGMARGGGFTGGFGGNFLHPTTRQSFGFRFDGFHDGFRRNGFFGSSLFYPGFGLGFSYWPDYYWGGYPSWGGYPYAYDPYAYSPYGSSYASYQTSPNVTVIYPQAAEAVPQQQASTERARPVTREYDQYGQEVRPGAPGGGSPVYLIAFNDRVIRAAAAYWVDGRTLHYVTLQHEERQAPLDTVDRMLSLQLNRERQVPFQLPAQ